MLAAEDHRLGLYCKQQELVQTESYYMLFAGVEPDISVELEAGRKQLQTKVLELVETQ